MEVFQRLGAHKLRRKEATRGHGRAYGDVAHSRLHTHTPHARDWHPRPEVVRGR